jgi:hypothetical protein
MFAFNTLPDEIQRMVSHKAIRVRRTQFIPILREIESQATAIRGILKVLKIDNYVQEVETIDAMSSRIVFKAALDDDVSSMFQCVFGSCDMRLKEVNENHDITVGVTLSYLGRHSKGLCKWLRNPVIYMYDWPAIHISFEE